MRIITTVSFIVFFMSLGLTQEIDQRLLEKYSQIELEDMKPKHLAMLNYALDNACYISNLPEGKSVTLETIAVENLELINFINLGLDIEAQNQYYKISGQEKMLVVKSEWVLNHEMNK